MIRSRVAALAVSVMASGCTKPTCDDVDHQLAKIVVTQAEHESGDAALQALPSGDSRFLPDDSETVKEIVGRCRAGELSDDAIRCLADARRMIDLDRCSRYGL